MTTAMPSADVQHERWGWRILMVVGSLMILDGGWLFLAIGGGVAGYVAVAGDVAVAVVYAAFAVLAAVGLVLVRGTSSP